MTNDITVPPEKCQAAKIAMNHVFMQFRTNLRVFVQLN